IVTAKDATVTQSLENGWAPLPVVEWKWEDITLRIMAQSGGTDLTEVRYTVRSSESKNVSLLLAVRPLQINPPWQRGGFSPIESAMIAPALNAISVNDEQMFLLNPAATTGGAIARREQDVLDYLAAGEKLDT